MTDKAGPIKTYAALLGKLPQTLRMAREGTPEEEQDEFDKEKIQPLHDQLAREERP